MTAEQLFAQTRAITKQIGAIWDKLDNLKGAVADTQSDLEDTSGFELGTPAYEKFEELEQLYGALQELHDKIDDAWTCIQENATFVAIAKAEGK